MLDHTAENILARFSDLENNPHETISPYLQFNVGGKLYYFTPGGFLYRRDQHWRPSRGLGPNLS